MNAIPKPNSKDDRELVVDDYTSITMSQYATISRMMKARGYDIRGAEDAKSLIQRQAGLTAIHANPKLIDSETDILQAAREIGKQYKKVTLYDDWAEVAGIVLGVTQQPAPKHDTQDVASILRKVVRKFGLTNNFQVAGYIMPNGGLLNLSAGGDTRGDDHRIVLEFLPKGSLLSDFVAMGPIRIMLNKHSTMIDIGKEPTSAQLRTIQELVRQSPGGCYLDIVSSFGKDAREYQAGVTSGRVIGDIQYFYKKHELPPVSKTAGFHTDETTLHEAVKSEVLGRELVDKFRTDYLLLMRNLSRIKDYSSLADFENALKRYAGSLEMNFGGRSVDLHAFSIEESPLRRAMFKLGLKPEEIDTMADYWHDELYKLLGALSPDRSWDRDVWHGSKDHAIASFNNTKAKWKSRLDKAARTFWNRMRGTFDLFSDMVGKKIDIPQDETIEVDGRNVILFGYNDEKDRDNLSAKTEGLKKALAVSRSKLPRLFPKNLHIIFKFTPDIKTAGEYHSYFGKGSRAISVSVMANTPQEAMRTLIHEAAHHYYYTVLDDRLSQKWRQVFQVNFKDSYLDLKKLASIWDKHEDMGILSLLERVLAKEDPILAKQVDYVIMHSRNQNSPFWTRNELQKLIDSGEKVPTPKMLASGYSGKNTSEMFAETVAAYLFGGPNAVPDYLIGLLKETFGSELKENSSRKVPSSRIVGYHCSGRPIVKHNDMAGLMGLLDTDYGSEWYGRILHAIGTQEALDLEDEEPSNIGGKEGRAWCEKALGVIVKNDMRILFVSDIPDHDYGHHCYSVEFPPGAKVTSFSDYNHPSATAYVFPSSVKPIFRKVEEQLDETSQQEDLQKAAAKTIGHIATSIHKGKKPTLLGPVEVGSGKMIVHGGKAFTPGEVEFKRVKEGWKGLLFSIGKSHYFIAEDDPDRAWLYVSWGTKGDAFNPSPTGLRASLQSIYDAHEDHPGFSANMNLPLPILYIPPESVPFIEGSRPGGEWLKPSTSLKDVVVMDGRRVILGQQQAGAAMRDKKALRAVDVASLLESNILRAAVRAMLEI